MKEYQKPTRNILQPDNPLKQMSAPFFIKLKFAKDIGLRNWVETPVSGRWSLQKILAYGIWLLEAFHSNCFMALSAPTTGCDLRAEQLKGDEKKHCLKGVPQSTRIC